jgi:virulence-associated protein VagC
MVMTVVDKPARTRVFRAGNSQAVRIPKEFELPDGDVYIEKREGGLFISTLRGRWDLFAARPRVDLGFTAADVRDSRPPREVDVNFAAIQRPRGPAGKSGRNANKSRVVRNSGGGSRSK